MHVAQRTRTVRVFMKVLIAFLAVGSALVLALAPSPGTSEAYAWPEPGQGTRTFSEFSGISRSELVAWLQSHEHDSYYLGTTYRDGDWASPNGDIRSYAGWDLSYEPKDDGVHAGMNCTGFVWHALCAAHGWKDDIAHKVPRYGPQYSWVGRIDWSNLLYYEFGSKQAMLASGVLEKGDIIWMRVASGPYNANGYHHVGFFWGDDPHEDKLWHSGPTRYGSTANEINCISTINPKEADSIYWVLKLSELSGGFAVPKHSSDPGITGSASPDGAVYSVRGAQYGFFDTADDAATHDAALATHVYKVGQASAGSSQSFDYFETENLWPLGTTVYMAEVGASVGFALDETGGPFGNGVYEMTVAKHGTNWAYWNPDGSDYRAFMDEPLRNPITVWVCKGDAENGHRAQGGASLEGAEFAIRYYDGYYTADDLPAQPTSTWIVRSDADGCARADDVSRVSGDAFYVDANGSIVLPLGTVSIQETKAPEGYLLDSSVYLQQITGESAEGAKVSVFNAPEVANTVMRGHIAVQKLDAETGLAATSSLNTLAGARFAIVNENENAVLSPETGESVEPGSIVCTIVTDETGLASTSNAEANGWANAFGQQGALAYGQYSVHETQAPYGYLIDEGWTGFADIRSDGQAALLEMSDDRAFGDLTVEKVDAETGNGSALGAAELAGAVFEIVWESDDPVEMDGVLFQRGDVVQSITATHDGDRLTAKTAPDSLPFGDYSVRESQASAEGYLRNEHWSAAFSIGPDERHIELEALAPNQVIRGDIRFLKRTQPDDAPMANVVFKITSVTTGEWHVLVSDEDGLVDTAATHIAHTENTNANDGFDYHAPNAPMGAIDDVDCNTQAEDEGQAVDGADEEAAEDDLPASEEYTECSEDSEPIDLPAVEVEVEAEPESEPGDENDTAIADENAGESLEEAESDEPVGSEQPLYQLAGIWFSGMADGTIPANDKLGALPYDTYRIEELECDANAGHTLADPIYAIVDQPSVSIDLGTVNNARIQLSTELTWDDGSHLVSAFENVELVDTVSYANLKPGATYRLAGELHAVEHDGSAGEIVAQAETAFTAEEPSGVEQLTFGFDASLLEGTTLVAFEYLYSESGSFLCAHEDPSDADQTVAIPSIETTLVSEHGTHEASATGLAVLVDTVEYRGLIPDRTYTLQGTLIDKETGGALRDEDGNLLEALQSFTPAQADGSQTVAFAVNGNLLAGKTAVAFESLLYEGRTYAIHADIDDDGQTVTFPRIGTTARDAATGSSIGKSGTPLAICDTVELENLTPGTNYTVRGTLHARDAFGNDAGPIVDISGEEVIVEADYAAETTDGTVELVFTAGIEHLEGSDVVVFEELTRDDVLIAEHADISDEGQTVHYPAIATVATDQSNGTHTAANDGPAVITDEVSYRNLIAGQTYTISGSLVDKETGEQLTDGDENPISTEQSFIADDASGMIGLEFPVDGALLAGRTVVAFEHLFFDDIEVAAHADIDDLGQSVGFPAIETSASSKRTGMHALETPEAGTVAIVDAVSYEGLAPGQTYKLHATLHERDSDGSDLGAVRTSEGILVDATATFTPAASNGMQSIELELPAEDIEGRTFVVFEELATDTGAHVASHADIGSKQQTVSAPAAGPTPETGDILPAAALGLSGALAAAISAIALALKGAGRRGRNAIPDHAMHNRGR